MSTLREIKGLCGDATDYPELFEDAVMGPVVPQSPAAPVKQIVVEMPTGFVPVQT